MAESFPVWFRATDTSSRSATPKTNKQTKTMSKIDATHLDVSITAICCLKNLGFQDLVLVGLGPHIEVYKDDTLVNNVTVFGGTSASIHGFRELTSKDSSNNVQVLVFGSKNIIIVQVSPVTFELSIVAPLIQCEDWILEAKWISESEVLVLTSHNRVLRILVQSTGLELSPEVIHCEEKCILYSGHIVKVGSDEKIIVLAGTVYRELIVWSIEGAKIDNSVLHRLQGHEGVIFSVNFCEESSIICTTSDDRTARLWKVQNTNENQIDWKSAKIDCVQILADFHTSRIFGSIFFGSRIVTIGEDSSFCQWSLDGIKISSKRSAHEGAPLWSADINPMRTCLYTGGGDGALKLWPLQDFSLDLPSRLLCPLEVGDFPKVVKHLDKDILLCLTNQGFVKALRNGDSQTVLFDSDLASYGIMEINFFRNHLILATICGKLKVGQIAKKSENILECQIFISENIFDGKMFALNILSESELLTCGPNGIMKLLTYDQKGMTVKKTFILPESKEQRWFSCAKFVSCDHLLIGDRCGNVYLFDVNRETPIQSFRKLHGRFGIGCIDVSDGVLKTAGRDSMIHSFNVENDEAKNGITIVRGGSVRLKFPWLEKIHHFNGQTFVIGFHSDRLVVYDLSHQSVACEMSCGGSHRSWSYFLDESAFVFSFVKEKSVEQYQVPIDALLGTKVIRSPRHSLEVNAVKSFHLVNETYVVTASEDTKIKIFRIGKSDLAERGQCVATLNSHISSVKCLAVAKSHEDKFIYIVSAGGRAQLKIWRVANGGSRASLMVTELKTNMLKGDDKKRKKTWRDQVLIDDAETRYMDVSTFEDVDRFHIVLACSDSVLRRFEYDYTNNKLELMAESDPPESHAFLRISRCSGGDTETFVTSSTNGKVGLWSLVGLNKLAEISVHKSGINSLLCIRNEIITGGDDGALGLVQQNEKSQNENQTFVLRVLQERCHSAHVTSILASGTDHIITCSVDQRVSVWKINRSVNCFDLICQKFSHVPDLHDAAVISETESELCLVVVGAGMQIFRIKY